MVEKRRGLGRGLGALISGSPSNEEEEPSQVDNGPSSSSEGIPKASSPAETSHDAGRPNGALSAVNIESESDSKGSKGSSTSSVSRETPPTKRKSSSSSQATSPGKTSYASSTPDDIDKGAATPPKTPKEAQKSSTRPSSTTKQPSRRSRPVDMFFSSEQGGTEEGKPGDEIADSDRKPATTRNRRVAVPDVLGNVRTSRDPATDPSDQAVGSRGPNTDEEAESRKGVADDKSSTAGESRSSEDDVSRETLVAVPGATFAEVSVASIHPNRKQPRTVFDDDDMAELVHSIREVGLLQPIVLRPSDEGGDQHYELVMGERRWRAVQEAGLTNIPAIVRETSDTALLRDALLENLHRAQLNPLEEAAAYQQLMQEFDCTQDELSERIGRSRPQISNTIRLMRLPALVQRRVAAGVLSAGHARALLGLEDVADMERLAQRIVNEGLSVRATEEIVAMNDGLRRKPKEKAPRSTARHERLDYLANSLSDHLETNVKISLGAKKGRVSIEFGSVDDLNRIMGVIAPSAEQ